MSRRTDLHAILVALLGSNNVYFQPPASKVMDYPCIVYNRSQPRDKYANNRLYKSTNGYMVTVIDSNPDSLIPDKVHNLPMCKFDKHYTSSNLNHDVYTIFY